MEIGTELISCKALLGGMTWLLVDNEWIADGKFTDVARMEQKASIFTHQHLRSEDFICRVLLVTMCAKMLC